MSRLDDELRNAFRREQPPADFTARVLERIARQPEPRPSWWQRLAALLEPPRVRWIAIGVTAALLIAIGAAQYSRLAPKAVDDTRKLSQATPQPEKDQSKVVPGSNIGDRKLTPLTPAVSPKRSSASLKRHQLAVARLEKDRALRAEAEAAKDKLMLALSIASSTLNDAQKAVHDDGPKP